MGRTVPLSTVEGTLAQGPLRNPKHESFARMIARGVSRQTAYKEAGFVPHGSNAYGLANREDIQARVQELVARAAQIDDVSTQQALEKAGVTKQMIVEELKIIAFARADDFFPVDTDGRPYLDLNNCDRTKLAAIKSIRLKEYYDEKSDRTVREALVEFHDKKGALIDLARMHGMMNDKANIMPTLIQINLNEADLRA